MLITKATLCTLLLVGVSLAADSISTPTANARNKEEAKAPTSCGAGMFQCPSSGRCIPQGWKCDMESDCEQGEDEKDCVQAAQQCSDTKEYKCEEADRVVSSGTMDQGLRLGLNLGFIHHCIPKEWRCDGEADCVNKDDEKGCETIKCDLNTHFECQSYDSNTTQCIPNEWKCDGQTDCLDMKDEEGCNYNPNKNNCDSSEFRCSDGQCIYSNWKCDGDRDCNDGSDEVNCEKTTCDGNNKFNCKSGFCIPSSWRCDGEIDCADHSDELDCAQTHANHTIKCTDKEFTCANNAQCISQFWVCDGDADCFDESDEKNCQDKKVAKECEKGQKLCKNGLECVDEAMWCNGAPECSDASDEADCPELKSRKEAQCNNDTEYQCPNAASQCIPYESLCKDGLAKNDCIPSVCNKNVFMCKEGEPDCVCRSTGTTGKACYCPTGYKYNGNECKDINECEEAGTCDQLCFNTRGSYRCDCYPGYKLTHPMKNESSTKCRAVGADPLLLLSNRAAIRQYDLHTNKYHPLITKLESAVAMDYWHKNQTLIWSDVSKEQISICHIGKNFTDATILGSLNDCLEKGNVTLIDKDVATPDGLAIDWVHGLLFWTDTGRDEINVMDLNTKRRKILFNKDLDEPRAIAVDPSLGLIFWTDWGEKARIERAGMNGEDRVAIIDKSIHVSWPNGLALDILDRRVYWADAKTKAISSSDYNGHHQRTVLRSNRHVKHPFSLAVFEERLYFTDWDQEGVLTVNKFKGNDVKILMRGVSGPMTVRIYHPQAQPNHTDKCFNHGCHHLCLPRAHLNAGNEERGLTTTGRPYSCACMDGFEFSIDNHSLCIPATGVFGAAAPSVEDTSSSSGLSLTYFLLLLVVALAFILGVMYRRHRPSQFTVLHFDNPVYRRTVEDLEADITDNSLGAISILPINPRGNEAGGIGGQMDGKLVINPSVLKSKEETKKLNTNSSYVDVHDPESYAYDQPLHHSQKT